MDVDQGYSYFVMCYENSLVVVMDGDSFVVIIVVVDSETDQYIVVVNMVENDIDDADGQKQNDYQDY